ncbi:MAG: TonB-dependent receptor plug domain-containing protein [Vitreoscilla sp.]
MSVSFLRGCPLLLRILFGGAAAFATCATAQDLASLPLDRLLDMPVSGASKSTSTAGETAAAVTVITHDEIRALGCRTLADVLATVKGVMITSDRSYAYLGVRGFYAPGDYNTRVLLLIDGSRANDALYDQAYVGSEFPVDLSLVERVEFIPGQASAVFGPNALFGVVNVVTRQPAAGAPSTAEATAGSFGQRKLRLEHTAALPGGGLVRVSGSASTTDGETVVADGARTPHGDFEQRTSVSLDARYGDLTLSAIDSHRTRGNPALIDTIAGARETRNIDDQVLFNLAWSQSSESGDQTLLRVFAGDYRFIGRYAITGAPITINQDIAVAHWWGAEGRVTSSPLEGHKVTAGAEFQLSPRLWQFNADIAPPGAPNLDKQNPSKRVAAFVEDQVRLARQLTFDASVRVDATQDFGHQASGRYALIWKPEDGLVVKAIHGSSYRPPNDFEAHYEVQGEGGYVENRGLRKESVQGSELNVEWHPTPSDRLSASIYRNSARALIVQVRDNESDGYMFANQGAVVSRGAELEWQHEWSGGERVRANGSFTQAVDHGTAVPVAAFAPHYLANVTAIAPMSAGIEIGATWRAVARRGGAGAYTVAGLAVSSAERPDAWCWSLGVANLFDRRYDDPGTDLQAQPTIAQASRTFELTLARNF